MGFNLTILNGSLQGAQGNTWAVAQPLLRILEPSQNLTCIHLADVKDRGEWEAKLRASDGFIFVTGTYWDSWGSPLQNFLEQTTKFEASDIWLGKPAAVLVTMHSVGGKAVLSRLQGVLSTLGMSIPPMSGMVYSLVNHLVKPVDSADFQFDLWVLEDLEILAHNFLVAINMRKQDWKAWRVDAQDPSRRWI